MNSNNGSRQARTLIPALKFTTEAFRKAEQFDAWCEFTGSMCDLEAVTPAREGYLASAESRQLGSFAMTSFQFSPVGFKYTKDIIGKSGFNHWFIGLVSKGTVAAAGEDRGFRASAGGTVLHSYARPFAGSLDLTDYSGLFFSRDEFWDIADDLDRAVHQPLQGPMSYIVSDFLASLADKADTLTVEEGTAVSDALGHLLRAMVRQTPETIEAAQVPIAAAQFGRVRRHIHDNLKSPGLTPESICAHLGISRRQLYYLFEDKGGVATFIRNRRLAACYRALAKSSEKRLISTIAYEYGFTNLSSFYRQFKARYGFGPGDARSDRPIDIDNPAFEGGIFLDWLFRNGSG